MYNQSGVFNIFHRLPKRGVYLYKEFRHSAGNLLSAKVILKQICQNASEICVEIWIRFDFVIRQNESGESFKKCLDSFLTQKMHFCQFFACNRGKVMI